MTGRLFGKYRSLRTLLASPSGQVHLALLETGGAARKVVLKVLLPPAAPHRVDAFLREARITSSTGHPCLMRALDFGQEGEVCFVALEPVVGASLAEILAVAARGGRRLPFEFVASVGSLACAGLAHAHTRAAPDGGHMRLVHCDLGPQHILVCEGGQVKIIGFSMARARGVQGVQAAQTRADQMVGNPLYLAPEQLTGRREPDGRADVFALGATLFELVAGKPAFAARSIAEIAEAMEQPAVPLTLIVRDVPLDLADAVARALELDPDARFTSAEEMRRAFDAVLARRGAHHPAAVIDAELRALQRGGLLLPSFESGQLPAWFMEGLGFDPTTGPLPEGTALEGGLNAATDEAPTQVVSDLAKAPIAPEEHLLTAPETPLSKAAIAEIARAGVLSPEDAWGIEPGRSSADAPPVTGSVPLVDLGPAAIAAPARREPAAPVEDERPRRGGGFRLFLLVLLTAAVFGSAGFYFATTRFKPGKTVGTAASQPTPTPTPGRASLEVVSNPAGAAIFIDGVETGLSTPNRVEVAPGKKHTLVLRQPDCLDWTGEASAGVGESGAVKAELVRAARINVASDPAGAEVEVDESPAFKAGTRSGPLKAGVHKVVVRLTGYLTQRREVTVHDSDSLDLSVPLAPGAEATVKSTPSGADVWLDGEDSGIKTPGTVGVAAGKPHVVACRKPGYIGQAKRLAPLDAGRTASVELALEDVLGGELAKRLAAKTKERNALEHKRDDLKHRFDARKNAANERAYLEAEAALDDATVDLQELQVQLRGHELVRK